MTIKDFKTVTGLFVVMLSFALLYSFNIVEPDSAENVYSAENTHDSEISDDKLIEQTANGKVAASTIDEPEVEEEKETVSHSELLNGFITSGTLIKQANYALSSRT